MGQTTLSDLAILSIESEAAENTDFDDVINYFATLKPRNYSKTSTVKIDGFT